MSLVLLPSFGAHLFDLEPDPDAPTLHIPPVIKGPEGWDLDYTSLLLFENILIDSTSYNYVKDAKLPTHNTLRESLKILYNEGVAEIKDYGVIAQNYQHELKAMMDSEAVSLAAWRAEASQAVSVWKSYASRLSSNITAPPPVKQQFSLGIWIYLKEQGLPITIAEATRAESVVISNKRKPSKAEQAIIESVARTYLSQVHFNLILARETQGAILDWENIGGFYRTKFLRSAATSNTDIKQNQKIKELFSIAVPDYKPESVDDYINLRQDKRVQNLRDMIRRAAEENKTLDKDFYEATLNEVIDADEAVEKIRHRTAIITAPLLLAHLPGHLAREAIVEGVERLAKRHLHKEHQWLLLLAENHRKKFKRQKEVKRLNK